MGGTDIHLPAVRGAQDVIFKSLFAPLAAEIGKGLAADYRGSHSEELSPSETDNLRRHADAVTKRHNPPKKEPTRKQRKELFEWIDDASETDPDSSPEDSAKWQAVLSEILGRNDQTSLEALNALNTFDVRAISQLGPFRGRLSEGQSTRLISLGIVEKRSVLRSSFFFPLILVGIVSLFPIVNTNLFDIFFVGNDFASADFARLQYQQLIAMAGTVAFCSFVTAMIFWARQA